MQKNKKKYIKNKRTFFKAKGKHFQKKKQLKKLQKKKQLKKKFLKAKALGKKLQLKRKKKRIKKYNILKIKCCSHNTIISLTLRNGKTLQTISCGSIGFPKAKKTKPPAMVKLTTLLLKLLNYYKIKRIICVITGFHGGLRKLIKKLRRKILVTRLIYAFNIAHNGCRGKKKRRK